MSDFSNKPSQSTGMKELDILATHHDMLFSLSMTGITTLKQGRFKKRHAGASEIVQCPTTGFETLRNYKKRRPHEFERKPVKKKATSATQKAITQPKIKRFYTIDKKQVSHRIKGFVNQMKGEKMLYFWTVTFPEKTTDDAAYILLNKWFTRLRKERMLKEYLWVAERQQNGTIHFHMVINNKMDVRKANRFMRSCIMYSIDNREINWSRSSAKNYNGVDIAKDRKTKRVINFARRNKQKALSNYLIKYVTKNDGKFSHLAWHSSRGYSNLVIAVRLTETEFNEAGYILLANTDSPLSGEWFTHLKWKASPPKKLLDYLRSINQHIQSLLN